MWQIYVIWNHWHACLEAIYYNGLATILYANSSIQCCQYGRNMLKWAVVCILLSMNLRKIRWPIRDMRLLLHFKHFLGISREIRCHYCDFTLRTGLIFTSCIVNQPNNMKLRWTADVNQLENSEIKITLQWIKWKILNQVNNYESSEQLWIKWTILNQVKNYESSEKLWIKWKTFPPCAVEIFSPCAVEIFR